MAIHGKYSDLEKEFIGEFYKESDRLVGWAKPRSGEDQTVTTEALKQHVFSIDPWNPFYSVEGEAISSRWGGLIAHPFAANYGAGNVSVASKLKPGLFTTFYLVGHEFEFFQPIRPGDTIRTWAGRSTMEDSTDLSGQGPRKFRMSRSHCDYINQRNEIVGTFQQFAEYTIHEGRPPVEKYIADYGYTQKELDYIAEIYEAEKPRGAEILCWEDVNVGDELQPVTTGPTRRRSLTEIRPFRPGPLPKRIFLRYVEPLGSTSSYIPDFDTRLLYISQGGRHDDDRSAQFEGASRVWLYNTEPRYAMARIATNWMGNDGFLCKFSWRHPWRTPMGDTLIIHGKVIKKYVENGEHMADIRAWCLNLRGTITDMAFMTVKLLSKEDRYPPAEKVIRR